MNLRVTKIFFSTHLVVLTSAVVVLLQASEAYDKETEAMIKRSLRAAVNRGKLMPEKSSVFPRKIICGLSRQFSCPYCHNVSVRGLITGFNFLSEGGYNSKIIHLRPEKFIENNCTDNLLTSLSYNMNQTHLYSWSFNDSLASLPLISITSGFPSLPWTKSQREVFGGFSAGPAINQSVFFEESVMYKGYAEIIIPPRQYRKVGVKAFWHPITTKIPFMANIEFSTIPEDTCVSCPNGKKECFEVFSHSDGVEEFLRQHDFHGEITDKTPWYLRAKIYGIFQGDYATRVKIVRV